MQEGVDRVSSVVIMIKTRKPSVLEDCLFSNRFSSLSLPMAPVWHFCQNIKSEIVLCGSSLFAPPVHMVPPSTALYLLMIHSSSQCILISGITYDIPLRNFFILLSQSGMPPFALFLSSPFTVVYLFFCPFNCRTIFLGGSQLQTFLFLVL